MDYLFTLVFLMLAHYFPMDKLMRHQLPHPMRLILNYVLGTVGMLLPFSYRLWMRGDVAILTELGIFVVLAGSAPVLTHSLDALIATVAERREAREERDVAVAMLNGQTDEDAE